MVVHVGAVRIASLTLKLLRMGLRSVVVRISICVGVAMFVFAL